MKSSTAMDPRKISDGTSQKQRVLPALEENYFNVNEMDFSNLLAMTASYARLVKFTNLSNQDDGTWEPYFSIDETVVIAGILATDLDKLELEFERFVKSQQDRRQLPTRELAKMINDWFLALDSAQSDVGKKLHLLIESVKSKLDGDRQALKYFLANPSATAKDSASLKSNFYSYVKAIEIIQNRAAQLLPDSLANKTHDPAVGLLIAFLHLFQKLKKKVNRFTQHHLDFYYDRVLMMREREIVPDRTYLVIQPSLPDRDVEIEKGTEFLAGLDENKRDIIYTSDNDVVINDIQVSGLCTLFFNRNRWSYPENQLVEYSSPESSPRDRPATGDAPAKQYPTHGWLHEIPVMQAGVAVEQERLKPYPTLGAPKNEADIQYFRNARIGFAFASQVLMLREGQRDITITLKFDSNTPGLEAAGSLEDWVRQLALKINQDAYAESAGQADTEAQQTQKLETIEEDAFVKVFRNMFAISLTTRTGWMDIPAYIPMYSKSDDNYPVEKNCLVIRFSLPPEMEAVLPYSSVIHGEDYATDFPVVRFIMNPDGYLYPYGFLKNLALKEAVIDVRVQGCRDVLLYNQLGQLAPVAPFNPFGPLPAVGSYFIIGSAEAAAKQLTSFDVDVEWGGLPTTRGGFRTYYQGYENPIENADIQVGVDVLANGRWTHGDAEVPPTVTLFNAGRDDDKGVGKYRKLSCSKVMPFYKPLDNAKSVEDFMYVPSSRNGFFKFTLTAPEFAFGHKEYPVVLAKVLTFNSRQRVERRTRPVPNEPYTPLINAISVNYTASATISLKHVRSRGGDSMREKSIFLHPLGWESVGPATDRNAFLLPQYDFSGNLFVGLRGTAMTGIVTLFFHLHEDSLPMASNGAVELRWFYLTANRWKPLSENQVISDTTQGFMTSGIITLDVPDDISADNTVMPGGTFWLRVSAENDLDKFCSIYSVYAQAVQVSRHMTIDSSPRGPTVLPAATIKRSRKTIPGVGLITQITPSFDGRPKENREEFRTRVSERLKHKDRALSAWDYERLILERFPEIYRVKCFANMVMANNPDQRIRPGHVLIVPLPYQSSMGQMNLQPVLSGHLINEVKDFIAKLASPFATIDVRNPVYEQIQARCTVKLKKGLSGGYYLNLLNQAISDFISPWHETGCTVNFGWCIRQHELESFIQSLDYIDYVTNFSMLRITPDGDDKFDLFDSAIKSEGVEKPKEINPKYPWSIAVPIKNHSIATTNRPMPMQAVMVGIGELEIGSTFIVSVGEEHGHKR